IKEKLSKAAYITGISVFVTIIIAIVIKLFVFSSPNNLPLNDDDYYKEMKKNYIIYSPKIPKNIDFAGEKVPIDRFDVHQSLDYEMLKILYWHSEAILYIKRMDEVFAIVEPILEKNGIPEDFKYLLVTESGLVNVVSPANAAGYWQFLKRTAQEYKLEVNNEVDERYNLVKSTEAACKYLKDSYRFFGNWTLAAASYNAGRGRINKELTRQKVKLYYDLLLVRETSRYVPRIIAFKIILSNPRDYGFYIRKKDRYSSPEVKVITVDTEIPCLIDFAKKYNTNYKVLKKLNPWLRSDKLTNSNGKTYHIKIPK
ncbi:MAG: lytic transglycosylase domain-containing protein, partial [Bacteroidota bacterium]|nr:lytic transglycosylase domain-containing protein [Bacteroidota bacterium]